MLCVPATTLLIIKGLVQLEKVLLNAAHVRGSIEGISGTDVDLNLLGDGNDDLQLD